jgi:DNA-binding Xre family transcriptional regulator
MSHIKPLSETAESVTLSRADFDAMLEELEDAEDRMAVLEDCLLDFKPEENRYLLSMTDTMRIIDGVSPITVWREKRGLTLTELASAVGLPGSDLAAIESGGAVGPVVFDRIAAALDVRPSMLAPVKAAP